MLSYINDNFQFWSLFLSPIPRRKMKFSTNFVAMFSLVRRIKSSFNCNPSLELRDITHAQYTYTHSLTGRISKMGLQSLQSYVCVRITSWITLVVTTIIDSVFTLSVATATVIVDIVEFRQPIINHHFDTFAQPLLLQPLVST